MNTQTNDLTTDDNLLTEDAPTAKELAGEFVRPNYTFKGQELQPYTTGTDLLFNQVMNPKDAPMTFVFSFIFAHLASHYALNDKKEVVPTNEFKTICWNQEKYQDALFVWMASLGEITDQERTDAAELFNKIRGDARKGLVEVVPDMAEKKTKALRRQKSRS